MFNRMLRSAIIVGSLLSAAFIALPAAAQSSTPRTLEPDDLAGLKWRSIGPANMAGRVAAIALAPGNAKTYYIGYATGGVWKTTNAGVTYEPVFDRYETSSIGSLAVCDAPADWRGWTADDPTDPEKRVEAGNAKIVWVGTGEGNGRNSSSWGHGVYRSTDGGESFDHLGLEDVHDIPALAVDPRDPDVCYVAGLGHLWGDNEERGVYKTIDGGRTWRKVLYIDEDTGACDVVVHPADPDIVFAAMYQRRRSIGSFQSGGPEGGIYRSTDGGANWQKLTEGLPRQTGRIGLAVAASNPTVMCAIVESDDEGPRDTWSNRSRGGGVFRSEDGGDTWRRVSDFNPRPFYFSRICIDPTDDQLVYLLGWQLYVSEDGGATFRAGLARTPHVDFHAMAINPQDPEQLLVGTDGGLYVSYDQGKKWDFHNHMAVGQFYNIAIDNADPYRVGGGLQDNGSWIGPSANIKSTSDDYGGRSGAITNADWEAIWWGDGFRVAFDPIDPNIVYAEWQGGKLVRVHLDTGYFENLQPAPKEGQQRIRFNWNAPFFVSPHDPTTLYFGGNCVFKLYDRGDRWVRISEDLSSRDPDLIDAVGSEAETAGTIVALAESPIRPGMLWAGTDDGRLHLTKDDGGTWIDVTPPTAAGLYIANVEPSRFDEHTAYVTADGHRSDVFDVVLLRTTDGGATWTSIAGDLPRAPVGGPVKVIREDHRNPDVLYAGTERGAFVTIDGGERWVRLNGKSLPTVPVDDLLMHPRERDLVAGTHGRSIWILDDASPLSEMTNEVLASPLHVFSIKPATLRYNRMYGGLWSDRIFIAENPPQGAIINYWLHDWAASDVKVEIRDADGRIVRKFDGTNRRGINRVTWDLQADKKFQLGNPDERPEFVAPGRYEVTVRTGDHRSTTTVDVGAAPTP
jgi:photosystem II stability/assembly factor-like uncharacterized protein